MRANVVYVPTRLCVSVVYVTCLRASVLYVPKACQLTIFMCQRANKQTNVPYSVLMFQPGVSKCQTVLQFFKHSSYEMLREISLYKKFCIILDIIVIRIMWTWIVHENCIILISILHTILKKSVWNFFFFHFCFLFGNENIKTRFLYVKNNKSFLEFSTAKTTKNREYVWVLWSSWTNICWSWRSEILITIVTMFLSISYDHVFEYCSS